MTPNDPSNNRVTIAVLSQQIQTLTAEVGSLRNDVRELSRSTSADFRTLSQSISEINNSVSKHATKIDDIEQDVEKVTGRVNTWSAVNSAMAVMAGVIGSIFGRNS